MNATSGSLVPQRFKKVGPNLYRDSACRYYLLVKKSGKQFRRSLKTNDPRSLSVACENFWNVRAN